ncbi:lipoprotein [Pusillimonas sp. MFBS29]|uniref:LPS translocon maturation chaperone LptM n=1 Tax=Pusillimonas sp. MFBS29 TaxID=2886690 RepID=UPI001D111BA8|nr:lipoprotein [Pusillimonas sp. MFBS29]MCC2595972.1 lipoprotein [Pusillimonas sp. MFBS29]
MQPRLDTHCKTAIRLMAGLSLAAMLAACGYKGPLYMPPPPEPDAELTTPPTPSSLPADDTAVLPGGPPSAASGAVQ